MVMLAKQSRRPVKQSSDHTTERLHPRRNPATVPLVHRRLERIKTDEPRDSRRRFRSPYRHSVVVQRFIAAIA